jgi:glycosyltransferase involved in cell wall biosynthesis
LTRGGPPPAARDDPAAAIRAFIEERRRRQGDEIKKALREAAREQFGEAFTVRRFDAAYAAVYGRRRGRPEKATSK